MSHSILISSKVAGQTVDSFVRSGVSADALDNGNLVAFTNGQSTTAGQPEVWNAVKPATGANLTNLWMISEPEVVLTVSGAYSFKNIDIDPRDFYNAAGSIFTAFKLSIGDVFKITADGLTGTQSTNQYVIAANGSYLWNWNATSNAGTGVTAQLVNGSDYISLPDGSIGTQRIAAFKFQVIAVS